MWFWRGTQSAIFYYVACTPCAERSYKKRRRRDAERTRKERDALELEQPGIIQQPVPFQTNRYWAEEIAAGPGPPTGRSGHERPAAPRVNNKTRKGAEPKRKSVFASADHGTNNAEAAGLPPADVDAAQHELSTRDAIKEGLKAAISERWNWIRHDRPDEILWGYEPISRILKGKGREDIASGAVDDPTTIASRRRRRNTVGSDTSRDYVYASRHPEINDLHPPVVSLLPRSRSEVAWMKQPPPPAAVMEGKVHPDDAPIQPRPLPPPMSKTDASASRVSPHKTRREHSRSRPPAIVISQESSSSEPSPSSSSSSRGSSEYPPRDRARSLSAARRPPPYSRARSNPYSHGRAPLATIVSRDSSQKPQKLASPASPTLNTRSSSPGGMKLPLPYDYIVDDRSSRRSGDQTPPEWDFLLAHLYSLAPDGRLASENIKADRPGVDRGAGMRASWHGHERRWSEL